MQTVRKYLVYEYVPIMEKTFRSGTRESCVAQQSIYIVLMGDEETRSYINQVRGALRNLLLCCFTCVGCNPMSTISNFVIRLMFLGFLQMIET